MRIENTLSTTVRGDIILEINIYIIFIFYIYIRNI